MYVYMYIFICIYIYIYIYTCIIKIETRIYYYYSKDYFLRINDESGWSSHCQVGPMLVSID